jgi:HlyD family secretion protein
MSEMNQNLPPPASGAAMDRVVRKDPRQRWIKIGAIVFGVVLLGAVAWQAIPRGFSVKASDIEVAIVADGNFNDELALRSIVVPLSSVVLDATEGGRVEEVSVRDGALVKMGAMLFRLSNPQRDVEVLARSADVAQQLVNLSNLRTLLVVSKASYKQTITSLEYELTRISRTHKREVDLAAKGFESPAALEESADKLAQQQRLLDQARTDSQAEFRIREQSVKELEVAIAGLNNGLRLVRAAADRLVVRAPVDGRLTGFQLQVGESVKANDRLGRIDSADRYKLSATVDEFYLNRIAPGLHGRVDQQNKSYPLTISQLNPQVKDGHFTIIINFDSGTPDALQPGKSIDAQIVLGKPSRALLLADGAFYADSGGAWVFVLDATGSHALRRQVRLGRRAAGKIEVLGGLTAGESVIVSAYRKFGETERLRLER